MKQAIAVYTRALGFYSDELIGYVGIPKEEIIECNDDDDITISSSAISIVETVLKEKIKGNEGYYRFSLVNKSKVIKKLQKKQYEIAKQLSSIVD
jgi:hypothetical protein